jgi:cyclopropane-fatty-acyl-phospholipid synthase
MSIRPKGQRTTIMADHRNVATLSASATDKTVTHGIALLEHLFPNYAQPNFQVRFWNGAVWRPNPASQFTLVLNNPGALRKLLSTSELGFGESYIFNDIDIEGDIESCFQIVDILLARDGQSLREKLRLGAILSRLPQTERPRAASRPLNLQGAVHSPKRDRQAISYHYGLPSEFYSLFLDPQMVYSCAYFRSAQDTLELAQQEKLEYICTKLRLHPGESLLDIGCGWGALIIFAAKHYGVRSTGITLSSQQADFARNLIDAQGLEHRCQVSLCDYRELKGSEKFDKIASVGMFEHVGEELLPTYFNHICSLLRPGGVLLNHGIAYSATYHLKGPSFVDQYVFPDGELVPISTTLKAAELSGLEVRDLENLREHYAVTLHHWVKRLETHANEARRLTDDVTYRIWRLYMAGAAHAFRTGRLHIYQALLTKAKHGQANLPLTREDWYVQRRAA